MVYFLFLNLYLNSIPYRWQWTPKRNIILLWYLIYLPLRSYWYLYLINQYYTDKIIFWLDISTKNLKWLNQPLKIILSIAPLNPSTVQHMLWLLCYLINKVIKYKNNKLKFMNRSFFFFYLQFYNFN